MAAHTQGTLGFDGHDIKVNGDRLLLLGVSLPMTHGPAQDEARANARRLVACWNVCAGISIEDLEVATARGRDDLRLGMLAGIARAISAKLSGGAQ